MVLPATSELGIASLEERTRSVMSVGMIELQLVENQPAVAEAEMLLSEVSDSYPGVPKVRVIKAAY